MRIGIQYRLLLGALLFLSLFTMISAAYVQQQKIKQDTQFKIHAAIIANDLWALSHEGARSYLTLAAQVNHFQYFDLLLENGSPFVHVDGQDLSGLDKLLHSVNLLPLRTMSSDILYHGRLIGSLQGGQYMRFFYPLLNIFALLLLLMLAGLFILNLVFNRRMLEEQVRERTQKYRDSERRFYDLVNLLPEMVAEADTNGNLTYANALALAGFKISTAQLRKTSIFDFIVPEQHERARLRVSNLPNGGPQQLEEYTARASDGSTFPVLIRSAPIYEKGRACGFRSVLIDISERLSMEKQLRQAQKVEVIGLMAGGVAHDLNNILSGIINYPELILMQLAEDSPVRKHVKAIKKSGLRASEIVADLLTVSRGVSARKVVSAPNVLVQEYLESPEFIQLQNMSPEISWETDLQQNASPILCSPIHFKKSLMNLMSNAAEAIDGPGTVSVSTTTCRTEAGDPAGDALAAGTYCVLVVSDTGPGITAENLEHIFEPFYTRKVMGKSGTGLGLTVVWNTMQDHDGDIRVHSDAEGTTFALYYPVTEHKAVLPAPEGELQAPRGDGRKILVVDDDPQQRELAQLLLTSLNYKTDAVSSGEEAVEYLRSRFVHLLLLDMLMPPGMNGLQTYKQILAIHPGQKAVIASGFSENEDVHAARALGAAAFIKKPYVMEELGRIVYTALR